MQNILKFVVALILPLAAGGLGSLFTMSEIKTWYSTLIKPVFSPPNWIFGPVWTTLYVLMGIALFIVWKKGFNVPGIKIWVWVFIAHLVINALWSIILFGWHSPMWAFVCIIALWLSIVYLVVTGWKISHLASILLWPYLAWVSFASVLNAAIWYLNR